MKMMIKSDEFFIAFEYATFISVSDWSIKHNEKYFSSFSARYEVQGAITIDVPYMWQLEFKPVCRTTLVKLDLCQNCFLPE